MNLSYNSVDLVTRDHLTPDASTESLQRIRTIASAWERRAEAFSPRQLPIATVSPLVRPANWPATAFSVYKSVP